MPIFDEQSAEFEAWWLIVGQTIGKVAAFEAWQFAVVSEREACAQICDELASETLGIDYRISLAYKKSAATIRNQKP